MGMFENTMLFCSLKLNIMRLDMYLVRIAVERIVMCNMFRTFKMLLDYLNVSKILTEV